jgi:phenylacetic acid degradation operon negative regulatory protein
MVAITQRTAPSLEERVELPRPQAGPEPQRMLTTMLGDYWFWRREHLPSAVLVRLLAEWGTSKGSARASIRRLADRGVLVRSRDGRTTSYGLRFRTREALVEHAHRLLSFGAESPSWDGCWTMVAFSIPEGSRNLRHSVRVGLRNHGLRLLYDGLWVSPFDRSREAVEVLRSLSVTTATVTRATEVEGSPIAGSPLQAFDLDSVGEAYAAFATRYEPTVERVRAGGFDPAEAFLARESLMSDWMILRQLDPDLPAELLPQGWPRPHARSVFTQIYDSLGPLGEQRFCEIVSEIAPDLGRLATHHTSTNMVPIPLSPRH